jgi:hypothetical protein
VLIEFADGGFTPNIPYAGLYAVVNRGASGDVVQAYGEAGSRGEFALALRAVADFAAGRLGPHSIGKLAGLLRAGEHGDPVLGVICAYLYKAIADFDGIRRLASLYARHGQPVPFDIALLGGMKVTGEGGGGALRLHVPAVAARAPRDGDGDLPAHVAAATPAVEAAIGGRCPWLALGWDYVAMARPDSAALVEGLAPHAPAIPRGGFTLLPAETGRALAQAWGLERR